MIDETTNQQSNNHLSCLALPSEFNKLFLNNSSKSRSIKYPFVFEGSACEYQEGVYNNLNLNLVYITKIYFIKSLCFKPCVVERKIRFCVFVFNNIYHVVLSLNTAKI